jgi:hypothetical protein
MEQKLEAIVEIDGQEVYDEKYIIAEVTEPGCQKKVLVSMPRDYHSEIARAYKASLDGRVTAFQIKGGGIITVDKKTRTIKTYGMSGSFGKPDVQIVQSILQFAFPDYKVQAEVTDFVRG